MARRTVTVRSLVAAAAVALAACSSGDEASRPESGSSGAPTPAGGEGADGGPVALPDGAAPSEDGGKPRGDGGPDPVFASKLYVLPQTPFAVTKIGDAVEALLAAKPSLANVIVFVHGRACGGGGEPGKSLGSVVPELESDYAAGVVMFHWPGSDDGCPLGFPEDQARAAGPALRTMVERLDEHLATHPATRAKIKLALLTHSMGNIVLEAALASKTGLAPAVFATAILNSSATAAAGHAPWLARLDFATNVYVTVNSGDNVLLAAGAGRGARLGRDLGTETLTARAAYVDFSAANVNHQYYVSSGQKGAHMRDFYRDALQGRVYDLAGSTAITKRTVRDGATVYTFDGK